MTRDEVVEAARKYRVAAVNFPLAMTTRAIAGVWRSMKKQDPGIAGYEGDFMDEVRKKREGTVAEPEIEVLKTPQLLHGIECAYHGKPAFLIESMDEAIAEAVARAFRSNVKTSVTMTLAFDPTHGDRRILVTANITAKIPEPGSLPYLAFADRTGKLVGEDPAQSPLPFAPTAVPNVEEE